MPEAGVPISDTGSITNRQVVRYYAQGGPQLLIQRVFDPNASDPNATYNADRWYWVVKGSDGTVYRLGFTIDSESAQSYYPVIDTQDGHLGARGTNTSPLWSPIRWRVDTITDVFGNQVQYVYEKWTPAADNYSWTHYHDCPGPTCWWHSGSNNLTTEKSRLTNIYYNYNVRSSATSADYVYPRVSGTANSRIELVDSPNDNRPNRIDRIRVHHLGTILRVIDLEQDDQAINACGYAPNTQRVLSITERDGAAANSLRPTTFNHIQLGHQNSGGCYQYYYINEINNGYSGRTRFTYTADGRESLPDVGYSYYVTRQETYDGRHDPQYALTEYNYTTPCYDSPRGLLGPMPGAFDCTRQYVPGSNDVGALAGFNRTTVVSWDYNGSTVLGRSTYFFRQDNLVQGQPILTLRRNVGEALVINNSGAEVGGEGVVLSAWYPFGITSETVLTNTTAEVHSGARSLKVDTTGLTPDHGVGNDVTGWVAGQTFWLGLYVKTSGTSQGVCIKAWTGVGETAE